MNKITKSIFDLKQDKILDYIDKNMDEFLPYFEKKNWKKADTKHFSSKLMKSYNKFVDGNRDKYEGLFWVKRFLAMFVRKIQHKSHMDSIMDKTKKLSKEQMFELFIKSLETGNIMDSSDDGYNYEEICSNTGENLFISFRDFCPVIHVYNEKYDKVNLSEINEIKHDTIIEMKIEFKTGNLLICDFFRTEGNEFAEIYDEVTNEYYEETNHYLNVNNLNDKLKTMELMLNKLNMIEFYATNTCSTAVTKNDNLYIMRTWIFENDEEDGNVLPPSVDLDITEKEFNIFKNDKTISNDRWTTCIIEKEQLLNLLAEKHGNEKANELVDGLLKSKHYRPIEVKVEPGTYYMYMDRNYDMHNECNHEINGVYNMNGIDFFLSREKLSLDFFEQKNNKLTI